MSTYIVRVPYFLHSVNKYLLYKIDKECNAEGIFGRVPQFMWSANFLNIWIELNFGFVYAIEME